MTPPPTPHLPPRPAARLRPEWGPAPGQACSVSGLPLERLRVKGEGRTLARLPAPPHSPITPIPPACHLDPRPCPISPCRLPLSAVLIDDLHSFDPATMTWTLLSAANDTGRPSARFSHGFTSAGGRLYVHGGIGPKASGANEGGVIGEARIAPCFKGSAVVIIFAHNSNDNTTSERGRWMDWSVVSWTSC
jgi:hypothetical protein